MRSLACLTLTRNSAAELSHNVRNTLVAITTRLAPSGVVEGAVRITTASQA